MNDSLVELENILRGMTFEACPCGCGKALHVNAAEGNDKLHKALTIVHDLQQERRRNAPRVPMSSTELVNSRRTSAAVWQERKR